MKPSPLPGETENLATALVDAALCVHRTIGPGLLEQVYEACLFEELKSRNIHVQRQVHLPLNYKGQEIKKAYRIDLLIENRIICEIKAATPNPDIWKAQILTYMRLRSIRLGFILNFNVPLMKQGIYRLIL